MSSCGMLCHVRTYRSVFIFQAGLLRVQCFSLDVLLPEQKDTVSLMTVLHSTQFCICRIDVVRSPDSIPAFLNVVEIWNELCVVRFAIDSMQSICLDEAGGEKAVDPRSQETTFIHYIFGGHLQSQVRWQSFNWGSCARVVMNSAVHVRSQVGSWPTTSEVSVKTPFWSSFVFSLADTDGAFRK